ncbi:uncharacterized protein LOC142238753 [Haematobia irritans]|uniref:Uncharacterized protein n=1 Tax=Haematobia irritans TaxID=7368 RepID=A0A1L8EI62_HAEIR
MVTLQSANLREHFQNPTTVQLRLLLSKFNDSCVEINKTELIFYRKQVIQNILEICQDCTKMAALPQGAFVACKLREQYRDRDLIVSRVKSGGDKNETKFFNGNKKLMEYSPVKYNEKLMNSIWGLYNRYSPHNIKSNEIVSQNKCNHQQQQPTAAAANQVIAQNIAMTVTSNMEWSYNKK